MLLNMRSTVLVELKVQTDFLLYVVCISKRRCAEEE